MPGIELSWTLYLTPTCHSILLIVSSGLVSLPLMLDITLLRFCLERLSVIQFLQARPKSLLKYSVPLTLVTPVVKPSSLDRRALEASQILPWFRSRLMHNNSSSGQGQDCGVSTIGNERNIEPGMVLEASFWPEPVRVVSCKKYGDSFEIGSAFSRRAVLR